MSTTVLDRKSFNRKIDEDNPILVNDENMANIDATYLVFYKALMKALEKNNLSKEEIMYASKLLTEVYLERRAKAFIDSKMGHIAKMSNHLIDYNPDASRRRNAIETQIDSVNLLEPGSFLIPSNSGELKLVLFSLSQKPKNPNYLV